MEGKGGCLIERYGGAFEASSSKVDRIMQRFRPIAPKPVSDSASASGDSSPLISDQTSSTHKKRKAFSGCSKTKLPTPVPISPEIPLWNLSPATTFLQAPTEEFDDCKPRPAVGSCVTVESIGDVWGTGGGSVRAAVSQWRTDEETRTSLTGDKSPVFVSDRFWRVVWVNDAYRKMACEDRETMRVGVVTIRFGSKDTTFGLPTTRIAFSCKVKVGFFPITGGKHEVARRRPLTAPCDVWSMDGGEHFVWRLDVDASLRLGR